MASYETLPTVTTPEMVSQASALSELKDRLILAAAARAAGGLQTQVAA